MSTRNLTNQSELLDHIPFMVIEVHPWRLAISRADNDELIDDLNFIEVSCEIDGLDYGRILYYFILWACDTLVCQIFNFCFIELLFIYFINDLHELQIFDSKERVFFLTMIRRKPEAQEVIVDEVGVRHWDGCNWLRSDQWLDEKVDYIDIEI